MFLFVDLEVEIMTSYNVAHQLGHLQLHADTGAIVTSGGDLQVGTVLKKLYPFTIVFL